MSNHIADASKMVDTPRTDAKRSGENHFMGDWVDANFARQLERELNAANDRIKRLRDGIAKHNQTIEQACGKVLGYPWFKDDQKNFPGSTEKDGVCVGDHVAETIVSELASRYTESLARIKRLEEDLGDAYAEMRKQWPVITAVYDRSVWLKAKEAKP